LLGVLPFGPIAVIRISMPHTFKVTAVWDAEAKVFTSSSDIPGLVVEADTFEEFVSLVEALAPEMLTSNMPCVKRPYHFDIQSHRSLAVA
jgi:Domain of unknown function (DUF1902)